LNKKVTSIKYDLDGQVQIVTSDGDTFLADHVIFTGSLGVLKKHHKSLFSPSLPQEKIESIENSGYGAVGKIFFEFDEPFWPLENSSFVAYTFLWDQALREQAKMFNKEWLLTITGFFIVDHYPNLLEGFLGGDKFVDFENISNEKLVDDSMWFFEKFLGKTIPRPKLIRRTNWLTNDNFLGTYSYPSMDAEKFNVGPKSLAKSLKNANEKPMVLFAGEATDFLFPSYANGAVSSGYRAADELISYYSE
jgi:spermine oxidase